MDELQGGREEQPLVTRQREMKAQDLPNLVVLCRLGADGILACTYGIGTAPGENSALRASFGTGTRGAGRAPPVIVFRKNTILTSERKSTDAALSCIGL